MHVPKVRVHPFLNKKWESISHTFNTIPPNPSTLLHIIIFTPVNARQYVLGSTTTHRVLSQLFIILKKIPALFWLPFFFLTYGKNRYRLFLSPTAAVSSRRKGMQQHIEAVKPIQLITLRRTSCHVKIYVVLTAATSWCACIDQFPGLFALHAISPTFYLLTFLIFLLNFYNYRD